MPGTDVQAHRHTRGAAPTARLALPSGGRGVNPHISLRNLKLCAKTEKNNFLHVRKSRCTAPYSSVVVL